MKTSEYLKTAVKEGDDEIALAQAKELADILHEASEDLISRGLVNMQPEDGNETLTSRGAMSLAVNIVLANMDSPLSRMLTMNMLDRVGSVVWSIFDMGIMIGYALRKEVEVVATDTQG